MGTKDHFELIGGITFYTGPGGAEPTDEQRAEHDRQVADAKRGKG